MLKRDPGTQYEDCNFVRVAAHRRCAPGKALESGMIIDRSASDALLSRSLPVRARRSASIRHGQPASNGAALTRAVAESDVPEPI